MQPKCLTLGRRLGNISYINIMATIAASTNVGGECLITWGNACDIMLNKNVEGKIVEWDVLKQCPNGQI